MDGIHKSIFVWGLITLIGFGVYEFTIMDPNFPQPMIVWTVLTVIGVAGMIAWVPKWMSNKVVWSWLVVGVGGMVYHWMFFTQKLPALIPSPWTYWALLLVIGFAATGYFWKSNFYYGVAVLNALALVYFLLNTAMIPLYGSLILGIVGGIPTMYDGLKG